MRGGQAIVEALRAQGVECVFGIPGVHNLAIYDGLYDAREIRQVVARHEQGAAFEADGYARATGRPGVVITTTGPGVTNALTGLGEANSDSSPVLHIASQIDSPYLEADKGFVHETPDQAGLLRNFASWQHTVGSVSEIGPTIAEAFERMLSNRPRPVFLEVPQDILNAEGDTEILPPARGARREPDPAAVKRAAQTLARADRPLVYAGGGVIRAAAGDELREIAELLGAPVFTTAPGKGAIADDHPLCIGNRWTGDPELECWLADADAILAVGTRFTSTDTGGWSTRLSPNLIQVDVEAREIGKNYPAAEGLVGDAKVSLIQLLNELRRLGGGQGARTRSPSVREAREHFDRKAREQWQVPIGLIETLRAELARDAILTNDSLIQYWTARHFPVFLPRTYQIPWNFGTLGTALPFAVGAKIAFPDRQVVAISGDAAFMFSVAELATAVQERANVVAIICNDHGYGAMRRHQRLRFGGRIFASDVTTPDFGALARSFGAAGYTLASPDELGPALAEALAGDRPAVIDLPLTLDVPWR